MDGRSLVGVTGNRYIMLLLIILLLTFAGMFVETTVVALLMTPILLPVVQSVGVEPVHFGVLMMTVVLIVNTCGKFLFGTMNDRLGVKRSTLIYGTVIAAGLLILYLFKTPGFMLAGSVLVGLCYSIPTVGAGMICRELFSPESYVRVYPKVAMSVTVCNALGYPLLGAVYDATGSYDPALMLVLCAMLALLAVVVAVYRLAAREKQAE